MPQECAITSLIGDTAPLLVTQDSFLDREKYPERLYVNIEGYPKHAALFLIKETLKSWLLENLGFCILISDPGARVPNVQTTEYYIRCLEKKDFEIPDVAA